MVKNPIGHEGDFITSPNVSAASVNLAIYWRNSLETTDMKWLKFRVDTIKMSCSSIFRRLLGGAAMTRRMASSIIIGSLYNSRILV